MGVQKETALFFSRLRIGRGVSGHERWFSFFFSVVDVKVIHGRVVNSRKGINAGKNKGITQVLNVMKDGLRLLMSND